MKTTSFKGLFFLSLQSSLFFLIHFFGASIFAFAATNTILVSQPKLSIETGVETSVETSVASASNFFTPKLEFEQLSFLSAEKASFDSEQYSSQLTTTGLSLKSTQGRTQVDMKWFYVEQEQNHYFDVAELSRKVERGNTQITIGRHLHKWSYADSFWQQGRWQPRFLWDYYSAREQGLTGFFVEKKFSENDRLMFFSGLHVPDMGPKYTEEDGRILSKNPWFHSPPEGVILWDQHTVVYSKVEEPRTMDVFLRPSVALQYNHDWSSVSKMRVNYAYKPINQTVLAFGYYLQLPAGPLAQQKAMVTIYPDYYYAHLATLENTWSDGEWSLTPSATFESPEKINNPDKSISQSIGPTTSLSLMLEHQSALRVYAGVLRLIGGRESDQGERASDQTFFQFREIYFMAYRLGAEGRLARVKQKNINAKSEITFDSLQKGGALINELSLQLNSNLNVSLKANFIGLTSADNKKYEPGFYNINRTNDLVAVGFNYVF